ncbi:protein kinase [bacterium]|nr:protein kinase [bacterium]
MEERFIGNYRVLERIGAGGMAQVYLAVHRDVPNLKVILKIVSDGQLAERFKQEADKLALLDGNANICRIRHFFNDGDNLAIAMEYIDGVSLDDRLKRDGALSIEEALKITARVLDVLAFAHQRGIFHRDIKPSNVMLDKAGNVKVIDFGIAKSDTDPNLTLAGTACGTPAYMAPEQFTPTATTNYALADVYATGTTLFYLLTGELPFKGDNEFAMRDAKLFNETPRPRSIKPAIPKEVEEVVLKAMDKEPSGRYQSAEEMATAVASALGRVVQKDSEPTRAADSGTARPQVKPKKKSGLPGFVIPAVVVVLLGLVAAYIFWPSGPGKPKLVSLTAPVGGEVLTTAEPQLRWNDPEGRSSFVLEYATDSAFSGSRTIAGLTGGSYAFPSALDNGRYYWRLYPMTASGTPGEPSQTAMFVVNADQAVSGELRVSIAPSGDVFLNDQLVAEDESSFEERLDTGLYVVRVENGGSREKRWIDTVEVGADALVSRSYSFTFQSATPSQPTPSRPVAATGEVRVGSSPRGADIVIDGELQRQKTNYTFKLKPGRHVIVAAMDVGGVTVRQVDTVYVESNKVHKVVFDFEQ